MGWRIRLILYFWRKHHHTTKHAQLGLPDSDSSFGDLDAMEQVDTFLSEEKFIGEIDYKWWILCLDKRPKHTEYSQKTLIPSDEQVQERRKYVQGTYPVLAQQHLILF